MAQGHRQGLKRACPTHPGHPPAQGQSLIGTARVAAPTSAPGCLPAHGPAPIPCPGHPHASDVGRPHSLAPLPACDSQQPSPGRSKVPAQTPITAPAGFGGGGLLLPVGLRPAWLAARALLGEGRAFLRAVRSKGGRKACREAAWALGSLPPGALAGPGLRDAERMEEEELGRVKRGKSDANEQSRGDGPPA